MFLELAHRLVVTGSRNFPNTGHHPHEPGEAIIMHAGSTACVRRRWSASARASRTGPL
jgi:hypothetical protein